jgi:uncharacterized protein DUF4160
MNIALPARSDQARIQTLTTFTCFLCYHVITSSGGRNMAEWTINGFKITMYKADHPPLHCHVRKDGQFIGKFNLETGTWMRGPKRHKAQANVAIARWRRKYGI